MNFTLLTAPLETPYETLAYLPKAGDCTAVLIKKNDKVGAALKRIANIALQTLNLPF